MPAMHHTQPHGARGACHHRNSLPAAGNAWWLFRFQQHLSSDFDCYRRDPAGLDSGPGGYLSGSTGSSGFGAEPARKSSSWTGTVTAYGLYPPAQQRPFQRHRADLYRYVAAAAQLSRSRTGPYLPSLVAAVSDSVG